MQNIRRVYLYLVSAISLVVVTWAVIGLARLVFDEGIGQGQITSLAWLLALIIVGLPIFLFHWLMAQHLARNSIDEQTSPVRQAYFYVVMAAGAIPIIGNIYRLLDNALLALVGGIRPDYYPYDLTLLEHLAAILIWGVIWVYTYRLARAMPKEQPLAILDINQGIRRIYLLVFSLAGLVIVTWGTIGLLQTLMEMGAGFVWKSPVANYSSQALIGVTVWVIHWMILQRSFATGHPLEERSVLRKIYLYLTVFVYSVMALSGGTLLLKRLIELALGAPPSGEPLLSQLSAVVPMVVVGLVFWGYHWEVLEEDAKQAPEAPRQASVRRVYLYLVAGVGLAATWIGLGGLLVTLIDMLVSPTAIGLDYHRETVALFVSMLVVGTPVWWLPWRSVQSRATMPADTKGDTPGAGVEERRSTVRKIYLYFFVFVASLVIFGSVGWFVYHILTALLGADLPSDFVTLVLNALILGLLAVGVWLYHWWAIRGDGRLAEQEEADQFADITVVVIDGDEGQLGSAIIGKLRKELPGIQLTPLGVTPQAAAAMEGQSFTAPALEAANYIVGPWQALNDESVSPVINAHAAPKLAVPTTNGNWLWVGQKQQSAGDYAGQIARGIKRAAEGEELSFDGGMDTVTIIGIGLAAIVFLCVASSLLGIVAELL